MLLKGLIPLIFGQKNGNFKQILVSNCVSVNFTEVSVSISVSKNTYFIVNASTWLNLVLALNFAEKIPEEENGVKLPLSP